MTLHPLRARWQILDDGIRSFFAAMRAFARGVPLFFSGRPGTPLRVLCLMAFDLLYRMRHAEPLPTPKLRVLALVLDCGACANAVFDRKPSCPENCRATLKLLNRSGMRSSVVEYLRRLRQIESSRPLAGGNRRQFHRVRMYREAVVRLSIGMLASTAAGDIGLNDGIREIDFDANLDLLFRMAMQCQIMDDAFDYSEDTVAGLPGFLTAAKSRRDSFELTRSAARVYSRSRDAAGSRGAFPLRCALMFVSACTQLAISFLSASRLNHSPSLTVSSSNLLSPTPASGYRGIPVLPGSRSGPVIRETVLMPTRVNGIGTAYHGVSNLQASDGTCDHCRRPGKLRNYETRLWFTVIFIPLIPLKRFQILNYCPSCTWHQAIPLVEWERLRDEAVQESADKWADNRTDPEAAMQMHATLASFQKRGEADRLASLMLERFGDVAKVQFYVGGWYEHTGKGTDADACFTRAFELDPDHLPARRAVAIGHLERGRPDAARDLLKPLEPPAESFEPGVFYMLAKSYQQQRQHEEALDVFQMLLKASPGLTRDKEFRRQMRLSEQAMGVEASAVPADPFWRTRAFGWTAAIVAAVVAILGWNFYIAHHRTVHVVNGLPIPISVLIDGRQALQVGPGQRHEISVAEGNHEAQVTAPAKPGPPIPFAVSAGWFDRFFKRPAWVLDPTRSAAIIWESAEYSERPAGDGSGNTHRWHLGQSVTTYPHVDYLFQSFPDSLHVDNTSKTVTKTRVDVLSFEPMALLAIIASTQRLTPDMLPFLEAHLEATPDERTLLAVYTACSIEHPGEQERCRKFIASKLADRPIRVDWHRCHQDLEQRAGEGEKVLAEYDALLPTDPQNSMLLYLRGRADLDELHAQQYYARAIAADPDNPYPWYAQGYRDQTWGEFTKAKQEMTQACRLNADDPLMCSQLEDLRFACGELEDLIKESREKLQAEPFDLESQQLLLEALAASGRMDEARKAHEQFAAGARGPDGNRWLANQSEQALLYHEGRFQELLDRAGALNQPEALPKALFEARLELGEIENLSTAGLPLTRRPAQVELLLSLAWSRKGNAERAAEARARAVALLKTGTQFDRRAAEILAKGPDLGAGEGEQLVVETGMKQILLTALADLCPAQRSSLLALAEKLNYRREFPHQFLKRTIDSLKAGEGNAAQ